MSFPGRVTADQELCIGETFCDLERQLCPEPAVQNFRLPGNEIVHLEASEILKSRRAASAVSPSGLQVFSFSVSTPKSCPAPLHPPASARSNLGRHKETTR